MVRDYPEGLHTPVLGYGQKNGNPLLKLNRPSKWLELSSIISFLKTLETVRKSDSLLKTTEGKSVVMVKVKIITLLSGLNWQLCSQ